jgi:hypothetical protein
VCISLARNWAKSQTPATTTIKATTNREERGDLNNFILCAGINQTALIRVGDDIRVIRGSKPLEKFQKKVKKKLVKPSRVPLEGNFERQMPSFRRSKKIQKSEKKACQGLRNLISLPKPNQTNGETNDKKRIKNV